MRETYKAFVDRMISKYEGGYGWNRKDTGGPTKYGITCFDLAEHMGQKMDSMARWAPIVQAMTLATAEAIYQTKYAAALHYDELPAGVDTECMDYGVNSGVSRPIHVLRAILAVPGPGIMDAGLISAAKAQNPIKLIEAISAERLHFMHAIRGGSAWAEFGGGWGARVADLKAYSEHLQSPVVANPPVAPDLTKNSLPKAAHGSPNTTKNVIKAAVPGSAGGAVAVHQAGLPPWAVGFAFGAIALTAIGVVIYERQRALNLNVAVTPPIVLKAA